MNLPWQLSASDEALFLRLVLNHVSDCLVVVDTDGLIVLVNQPYCKLLGGEEADFIGRHISDVVGSQTRLHHVARGDEGPQIGYPLEVRGHQLITKQVPILQNGRSVGAIGMALFSDLDALKRTYSRMAQSGLTLQRDRPWACQFSIQDVIGQGSRMESYRHALRQAAAYDFPVLISGETGTGKELAAQSIHGLSDRAAGPFVWVNCASIPAELIDAELFGYEGGAFTGARSRGKPGKFELAQGGTLFLDEIGDMPMSLQGSLLRVLQTQEIVRVGGTAPIGVRVRVICATNLPLSDFARSGRFRQDLFYRLNVLPVQVPALRDRDDRPFLIEQLLDRLARRLGAARRPLPASALARMMAHPWRGNVRELESVLIRFLVTGNLLLDDEGRGTGADIPGQRPSASAHRDASLATALDAEKVRAARLALEKAGGDKRRAAELLGISRAQIYRILKKRPASRDDAASP
ncbi:sigma-54 interaction domain-containing protein [Castellaniella sp.]|uniref:sigma-54 interaction domain-containing protein n=1 Tax=Castellaniella sp. TaxID=1955812 RepID=UPI003C72D603